MLYKCSTILLYILNHIFAFFSLALSLPSEHGRNLTKTVKELPDIGRSCLRFKISLPIRVFQINWSLSDISCIKLSPLVVVVVVVVGGGGDGGGGDGDGFGLQKLCG